MNHKKHKPLSDNDLQELQDYVQEQLAKIPKNKLMGTSTSRPGQLISKETIVAASIKQRRQKKAFLSHVSYDQSANMAIFSIFSDFFNVIYQDKELQEKYGISDMLFQQEQDYYTKVKLGRNMGVNYISFKYKEANNARLIFTFAKFKDAGNIEYYISLRSDIEIEKTGTQLFKEIRNISLSHSKLKGSYFVMPHDAFVWDIIDLEKRSYSDIFFPSHIMEDVEMYTKIFDSKQMLLRYLLAGTPGTGKTESTLAIANYLNDKGVTVIKTQVCGLLKEKLELAKYLAPSLVIFDDIDLDLGSRSKGSFSSNLGSFLDALDGTEKMGADVGIIATTNSPDMLDLAAQRPGRFDTMLYFNELTKDNIRNIILKSLKMNFKDSKPSDSIFHSDKIVSFYHKRKSTGAYIYNSTKMLKLKSDILEIEPTEEWIIKILNYESKYLEEIRRTNMLERNFAGNRNGRGIGHEFNPVDQEEYVEDDCEKCEEPSGC